jgi:hypothetical protein
LLVGVGVLDDDAAQRDRVVLARIKSIEVGHPNPPNSLSVSNYKPDR